MEVLISPTETFDLNQPTSKLIDQKLCVYDCADKDYQDFFFKKISTFISYRYPSATLLIGGKYRLDLPLNWRVLVTNSHDYICKLVPIEDLLHFDTNQVPLFNPFHPGLPQLLDVEIHSLNPNPVEHFVPKLPKKNLLVMPITNNNCFTTIEDKSGKVTEKLPNCIYCMDDIDSSKVEFDLWSMVEG